jgi:hypothetical protein
MSATVVWSLDNRDRKNVPALLEKKRVERIKKTIRTRSRAIDSGFKKG